MGREIWIRKKKFLPILFMKEVMGRDKLGSVLPMLEKSASMGREIIKVSRNLSYHNRIYLLDGKTNRS